VDDARLKEYIRAGNTHVFDFIIIMFVFYKTWVFHKVLFYAKLIIFL